MALFSRRKKSDDQPAADTASAAETGIDAATVDESASEAPTESVPDVSISVQAFRGVGAEAGPEVIKVARRPGVPWQSAHWISMAARTSP